MNTNNKLVRQVMLQLVGNDPYWNDPYANTHTCVNITPEVEEKYIPIWRGSQKYPPLLAGHSDFFDWTPTSGVANALRLGFIEANPRKGVFLTTSGHAFLDILGNGLMDTDAPIRWHKINAENKERSDEWLDRHFKKMKRQISKHKF